MTTFASTERRAFVYTVALVAALDLALAYGILRYFETPSANLTLANIAMMWLLIQGVRLALGATGAIAAFVAHKLYAGRLQEDATIAALESANAPMPEAFETSPQDYLVRVAGDDTLPDTTRVQAASLAGMMAGASSQKGLILRLLSQSAWERAIARYNRATK